MLLGTKQHLLSDCVIPVLWLIDLAAPFHVVQCCITLSKDSDASACHLRFMVLA
jgi:hypothetical protein